MSKIYVYYGERKDIKKLSNLSFSIKGLSYLGPSENFCGLRLSEKLERRLKLFTFDNKNPRKIAYLYKIISKCKIIKSDMEYAFLCNSAFMNKDTHYPDKKYKKLPKGITKDNQNDFKKGSGYQSGNGKQFCIKCNFTHKHYNYPITGYGKKNIKYTSECQCSNCGAIDSIVYLHSDVRVPRKDASKKVWKKFYKLFIDPILEKRK
jgi:hypothetical protein